MEQQSLFALDLQLLLYKNLNDKNIEACWLLDARQDLYSNNDDRDLQQQN